METETKSDQTITQHSSKENDTVAMEQSYRSLWEGKIPQYQIEQNVIRIHKLFS